MKLAFLFHIYQPITQDEDITRKAAVECYLPLVKLLKNKKNLKLTLNIPLSLIQQMDKYGYSDWINDVKELVESGRVELTGTGAYHAILPKLDTEYMEKQIILQEYGMGYYFGGKADFEGDPSILLKDIVGFFPPEVAVDEELLESLNELGYRWMFADETAIPFDVREGRRFGVYNMEGVDTRVVVRNRDLSNLISFKRDTDTQDFTEILMSEGRSCVVALDGEYFGHHFKEGIFLLDILTDELAENGVEFCTVSEYVKDEDEISIENLETSTWGTSDDDLLEGKIYPRWDHNNRIHDIQWEIVNRTMDRYSHTHNHGVIENLENVAIWKTEVLSAMDDELRAKIELDLLVSMSLNSDQFWWASQVPLEVTWLIERTLTMFEEISERLGDEEYSQYVKEKVQEVRMFLEHAEELTHLKHRDQEEHSYDEGK